MSTIRLKIRRQDSSGRAETRRFEEFDVERTSDMTVADALAKIRRSPVTADGRQVAPVAFEDGCLGELCGECTVRINRIARPACTTRVDVVSPKGKAIVVEPLAKFPIVRDLIVDRTRIYDDLGKTRAWVALDGTTDDGPGPRERDADAAYRASLDACTGCGACLDACPQYGHQTAFVGALVLNEVEVSRVHPTTIDPGERVEAVMGRGGVSDCGKAQNCVEVCPAKIPLVDSIQRVGRAATKRLLLGWMLD